MCNKISFQKQSIVGVIACFSLLKLNGGKSLIDRVVVLPDVIGKPLSWAPLTIVISLLFHGAYRFVESGWACMRSKRVNKNTSSTDRVRAALQTISSKIALKSPTSSYAFSPISIGLLVALYLVEMKEKKSKKLLEKLGKARPRANV